jgi:hypothetical protein
MVQRIIDVNKQKEPVVDHDVSNEYCSDNSTQKDEPDSLHKRPYAYYSGNN